jgi:hypothetical protein
MSEQPPQISRSQIKMFYLRLLKKKIFPGTSLALEKMYDNEIYVEGTPCGTAEVTPGLEDG